ncbi:MULTISPECIES: fatty acid desaturase [Alteromonadaceae]|jgi:fatty acid desaturase|uniref:Fatty acid desaturase n=1 Tax=Brumicola blandensis TaxID=3075611 RepID=A0AAW8R7G2_9ALTE|nr:MULTISPECIES: fatty acid desaturase [unclassified Alteromonas]MDT0583770.1 fatty acid desaturase [Alteromonas sp. W409]MDT0629105.1 fatty acid desaturase [Alteromonas sp. W364]
MTNSDTKLSIKTIVKAIKDEEKLLREKYKILSHQDMLGLGILLVSFSALVGVASLYFYDLIPAWVCVLLAAVITSISHELEHDLIHKQYFSNRPMMHNFMMLMVWIMRPNTINPWYRRKIHLHHHKTSGTQQDLEERLVGNGIKNPFLRFLVIVDGLLGLVVFRKRYNKEIDGFSFGRVFHAAFPIATAYFVVLYSVIVYHLLNLVVPLESYMPAWGLSVLSVFEFLMVVLVLPNIIRSSSLNFVTSSMHYYGNVNNVYEQTHVLTSRLYAPFHLFCFNFGKTHTIHHFVPNQPFYLRQLISDKILKVMKEQGVRFNDFESIKNANLYSK